MNEEKSVRLAQEMYDAKTEGERTRVLIHWLPALVQCLMATAGRVKMLVAKLDALEAKVDALHPPTPEKEEEAEEEDESAKKVPAYLVWLGKNWQWILIFAMCLKNQGLVEAVRMLLGGSP